MKKNLVSFFVARKKRLVINIIIFTVVFLFAFSIDQITKYHFFNKHDGANFEGKVFNQNALFGIRPYMNTGMMVSLLAGGHTVLIQCLTISIMLICIFSSLFSSSILATLALAFISSGAFGNIFDRFATDGSYVRDFLFTPWADRGTFNLADVFVIIGAGLFVINTIIILIKDSKKDK